MKDKVVEQTDDPLVIDGSVFSIQHEALLMDIKEGGKPDLMTVHSPGSAVVEQYKELFMALDRACQPAGKKIIAVTSAMQGEGKTATVANLAVVAARNFGKKCLLVDTHFKRPFIASLFRLGRGLGLIDVMMQRRSLEDVLTRSSVDNLTLLPMGHFLGKRAEVLNVGGLKDVFTKIRGEYYNILWNEDCDDFLQMEQQETDLFDYIFVDSPPASSPEMAIIEKAADALLLVVRAESVPREIVQQAVERLDSSKLIGAV
jgi:tyrosine-protein kinase Etk/Wzc